MQKRYVIWGCGNAYKGNKKAIMYCIQKKLEGEVVAIIDKESQLSSIDGLQIYRPDNILGDLFDEIIICARPEIEKMIRNDIVDLKLDKPAISYKKVLELYKDTEAYKDEISSQCKVLTDVLNASDEEIKSYDWVLNKICEYGVYPFCCDDDRVNWTDLGVLQIREEFAKLCVYLSQIKINEAIEIGVFKGRSSYFMCAILMRNNPMLNYICVDIYDNLDSYEEYHKILPALDKQIPTTSEDYKGKEYDFVFIDADHSYDASIQDYFNVGCFAKKLTIFHDIYGHEYDIYNGGTVRMWKEVKELTKEKSNIYEFSKYPDEWMGIGVVEWKR